MERLRKILKLTGFEFADGLILEHEEFVEGYNRNQLDYILPKRYINIFYRIPDKKSQQILIQLLLLLIWACVGFGIFLLIKKIWIYGALCFLGAYTIKKWTNVIVLKSIKNALIRNKSFFEDLNTFSIIGVYPKNNN